jgi:hypothetical protein
MRYRGKRLIRGDVPPVKEGNSADQELGSREEMEWSKEMRLH